jgi:hypothetical protein
LILEDYQISKKLYYSLYKNQKWPLYNHQKDVENVKIWLNNKILLETINLYIEINIDHLELYVHGKVKSEEKVKTIMNVETNLGIIKKLQKENKGKKRYNIIRT